MLALAARLGRAQDVEPSAPEWFKAYELTQPSQIKVVCIAQDPYPGGEAMGLAFSTRDNRLTESLKIIFAELELEYGFKRRQTDLTDWARQGVFLINSLLTTKLRETQAHKGWGWEYFIAATLRIVAELPQQYVVMSWGTPAREVTRSYLLDAPLILDACHPAAEKHGRVKFTGCGHFKKANEFLESHNVKPIKWV